MDTQSSEGYTEPCCERQGTCFLLRVQMQGTWPLWGLTGQPRNISFQPSLQRERRACPVSCTRALHSLSTTQQTYRPCTGISHLVWGYRVPGKHRHSLQHRGTAHSPSSVARTARSRQHTAGRHTGNAPLWTPCMLGWAYRWPQGRHGTSGQAGLWCHPNMKGSCQKGTSAGRQSLHWVSPNYVTSLGLHEGWAKEERQDY